MEHIQGFTRSHWMPPSGDCLRLIDPAAAMVDDFKKTHKTLTKHNFKLATTVHFELVVCENFVTRKGPSTHFIDATSVV
jgi:hypothetical protein